MILAVYNVEKYLRQCLDSLVNQTFSDIEIICTNDGATANLPVFVRTAIADIPVLCKAGNTMYANQLNTRVRYPIMYGNGNDNYTNGQFVITCCVNPKSATTNNSESV